MHPASYSLSLDLLLKDSSTCHAPGRKYRAKTPPVNDSTHSSRPLETDLILSVGFLSLLERKTKQRPRNSFTNSRRRLGHDAFLVPASKRRRRRRSSHKARSSSSSRPQTPDRTFHAPKPPINSLPFQAVRRDQQCTWEDAYSRPQFLKQEQFSSREEMSTTNMDLDFHSKMPTKAVVSKVSVNLPGVEKQAG